MDGPDTMTYLVWVYKDDDLIDMLGPLPSLERAKEVAACRGATLEYEGTA